MRGNIGKIRRRRLVEGEPIGVIARDLGLARNTPNSELRFEGEAYEYRQVRQPRRKLGPFLTTLAWNLKRAVRVIGSAALVERLAYA